MLAEAAIAVTLHFTLPSTGQRVWTSNDTSYVECDGGPAVNLQKARLYWQPATGGGYRLLLEKDVAGKAGRPDSFTFDRGPGGHAYVVATNAAGVSCPSNVVWVPGQTITEVPTGESGPGDAVVSSRYYDVQGRRIVKPGRSGVYWRIDVTRSGATRKKKLVIVK
jgi:hypothetical protein